MQITRRFTKPGIDVFSTVEWTKRRSRITNADGSVVFEMNDAEVPKQWSQLATDIMVSKYFRKAGVPVEENLGGTGVPPVIEDEGSTPESSIQDAAGAQGIGDVGPAGLAADHRRDACATKVESPSPRPSPKGRGGQKTGPEKSARQVIHRLAGCWRHWGEQHNYFDTADDAQAFYDELSYMMLHQMSAPNSPQWFNTGLNWAYGINGPAQGHWIADPATGGAQLADDAYSHPQPHACFIQSISDDLVNEGGIMDLWTREARLFKYGSGTGTNFSKLRGGGESLSGGGKSSGLMSFLKIGDRAAGAIKSGGTTRRAAKMVCLDADHPDIEEFVNWKVREELKVAAMVEGLKHLDDDKKELAESLGLKLSYDFNGEAYYTVSGQNSNNSVRLTDDFFKQVKNDGDWELNNRTTGDVAKTIKARDLWGQICRAAWRCADPGVQYDSAINAWHTCPADGRINASNPCSEYMFLDDTACNLASVNLLKFYNAESRQFDLDAYEHAIDLWTVVLEISVLMASFPSREIADRSWRYRTLGLGYANLGAMLMQAGVPYDSEEGRAVCGMLTAILTGRSYATSAVLAKEHGAFAGYASNREPMLRVIRNHRRAAHGVARDGGGYEGLEIPPVPIDGGQVNSKRMTIANADDLLARARGAWDDALQLGQQYGYRNAQVSVIAPTGTIGLLMDCDTTGVEPDFALTKFKKLAGGGYFKIANQSLRPALQALGYTTQQIEDIITFVMGTLSLHTRMPEGSGYEGKSFREFLVDKGFEEDDLQAVEDQLPAVFELGFAFSAWSIPDRILELHGVDPDEARANPSFTGLKVLGLKDAAIRELNDTVCGMQTIEGAPHLKDEHLPVFDCANKCGNTGVRFIAPQGHIRMMSAAQPFISGAISKTINLPREASEKDIADCYWLSWELGLKANALYRDGCKLSQPLSTKSDADTEDDDDDAVEAALSEVTEEVAELASVIATPEKIDEDHEDEDDAPVVEKIVERIIERPMRRRLPETRQSVTHRFNVAGHEGYLTVGLYSDGRPGELFITMSKEGSTIGGLMDSLGTAISVALQYGVPVESLVTKFAHQRFEPMGMTGNRDIPFAKSLVDYIFRWLGMEFIPGFREQNAPKRSKPVSSVEDSGGDTDDRPTTPRRAAVTVKEDDAWSTKAEQAAQPSPPVNRMKSTGTAAAKTGGPTTEPKPHAGTGDGGSMKLSATRTRVQIVETAAGASTSLSAESVSLSGSTSALDKNNAAMMGDAPACDVCGAITVRNGACYRCENCGNSLGCS